ncbi:uncharacterized protein LOC134711183 isoform X2 [Mytilus trossulus]
METFKIGDDITNFSSISSSTDSNISTASSDYVYSITIYYIGALAFTMLVVMTVAFIIMCHVLRRLRHKTRPPEPVRMTSNNDFNIRISDVFDGGNKRRMSRAPGQSRNTAYFRQDSQEASRFDRMSVVPYAVSVVNENLNPKPIFGEPPKTEDSVTKSMNVNENMTHQTRVILSSTLPNRNANTIAVDENIVTQQNKTSLFLTLPNNATKHNPANEIILQDKIAETDQAIRTTNEYQVPRSAKVVKDNDKTHYQIPGNHYQTPKSPIMSKNPNYQTPKAPRKVIAV